jgi:hypothetical protein
MSQFINPLRLLRYLPFEPSDMLPDGTVGQVPVPTLAFSKLFSLGDRRVPKVVMLPLEPVGIIQP